MLPVRYAQDARAHLRIQVKAWCYDVGVVPMSDVVRALTDLRQRVFRRRGLASPGRTCPDAGAPMLDLLEVMGGSRYARSDFGGTGSASRLTRGLFVRRG